MKTSQKQKYQSSHQSNKHENKKQKRMERDQLKYMDSTYNNIQQSNQVKIYNRNVYLRQAYKTMIEKKHQQQIKQLANSRKIDTESQKILKIKIQQKIQKAVYQTTLNNPKNQLDSINFQQMCQIIFKTNQHLRKAQHSLDIQQLLSQLWLYLKNYEIQTQFLDVNIFSTFLKILMNPKGLKPAQIKQLMAHLQTYANSNFNKQKFLQKYPDLRQQALEDIQIFKLWFIVQQKYNLFNKNRDQSCQRKTKSLQKKQLTFKPQINQKSRMIAERSLNKYLSNHKLDSQKILRNQNSNDEQKNELNQYLSHKNIGKVDRQLDQQFLDVNKISYHDLLYKRKLQKEDISRKLFYQKIQSKQNIDKQKLPPQKIKEIVDKLYFIPEKKPNLDYKELSEKEELKNCTFHPTTNYYEFNKKENISINGYQKEISRLRRGRQEKEKLRQTYQNLGKPKNSKTNGRTPSFVERDMPKLILEVNIGDGRIEKIKLHGNEDKKIVAKKFINKHNLQNSMLSVLQELIEENLKNI